MSDQQELSRCLAIHLTGDVLGLERIGGGRNSQVYKVMLADGRIFAAKVYFRPKEDQRDRLGTEFNSLRFLWDQGIRDVPEPLISDRERGFAVYDFIDGSVANATAITQSDIDQAVDFLIRLEKVKTAAGSESLPAASEACFSVKEMLAGVERRFQRLSNIPRDGILVEEMLRFLEGDFLDFFRQTESWVQARLAASGLGFNEELPRLERTLSPSDFGYHNAIRQSGGHLIFLDFEYFGWDDPAKMMVDFILHPGMNITWDLKQHYLDRLLNYFEGIAALRTRVEASYAIFGLKWCTILLNEFVPVDLERRNFAATETVTLEQRRWNQLEKVRRMLSEVQYYCGRNLQFVEKSDRDCKPAL